MNSFPLKVSRKILMKTAATFFSILLLAVVLITRNFLDLSKTNTMERIGAAKLEAINTQASSIAGKLHVIENTANQILSNQHIWRFIYFPQTNEVTYSIVRDIIQSFDNIRYAEPLIESIYFYDSVHSFVIGDGIYEKERFFDQELLARGIGEKLLYPPKLVNRSTRFTSLPDVNITSYVRELNIAENRGVLVINAHTSNLFEAVSNPVRDAGVTIVTDADGLLYAPAPIPEIGQIHLAAPSGSVIKGTEGTEYAINRVNSVTFGFSVVNLQNYRELTQTAAILRQMAIPMIIIITLASAALIIISSLYIHHPLLALLGKIKRYYPDIYRSVKKNEYAIIHKTMDMLQFDNSQLQKQVELAIPYLKNHSLQEFLINPVFRAREFNQLLQSLAINFPHNYYYIVLLDSAQRNVQSADVLEVVLKANSESIQCVSCQIDQAQTAVLVNTSLSESDIKRLAQTVLAFCRESGLFVRLCVGEPFEDLAFLPQRYYDCAVCVRSNPSQDSDLVIAAGERPLQDLKFSSRLEDKLIEAVKGQQDQKIKQAIGRIFADSSLDGIPMGSYQKYMTFHLIFRITGEVAAIGAVPSLGLHDIYQRVENAREREKLKDVLYAYSTECAQAVQALQRKLQTGTIKNIIDYIQDIYTRDISIEEIAGAVCLSPNYLSSIFKANTGSTVLEYITSLRMTLARTLLLETDGQIKEIAARVGYNSVQSFNRYFKQLNGVTPVQYRLSNAEAQREFGLAP